jgi:hypothetical protein
MVVSSLYLRGILHWNKASHFRYYGCNPEGMVGMVVMFLYKRSNKLPIPHQPYLPLRYRELTTIMLSIVPYHSTLAASTPITLFVEMLKTFTQNKIK